MARANDIQAFLDNDDEPLPKRLKVANALFKSPEVPFQNKEAILLKWVGTHLEQAGVSDTFNSWLKTEQFKNISRIDITQDIIVLIVKELIGYITNLGSFNNQIQIELAVDCIKHILQNTVFEQHFKHDPEMYCELIGTVVKHINDEDLLSFIQLDFLFSKKMVTEETFTNAFLALCYLPLVGRINQGADHQILLQDISNITQRCLFYKKYRLYETYMSHFFEDNEFKENVSVAELIFKHLSLFYDLEADLAKYSYKIIFIAFSNYYNNNFITIYEFFILLLEHLGFTLKDDLKISQVSIIQISNPTLNKSLTILSEILDVFTRNKSILDCKVGDVTFSDILQKLLITIIHLTKKPNKVTHTIFNHIITINPLVVEPLIQNIFVYFMLANNEEMKNDYQSTMIAIFGIFSKLHRVQSLISKMIPTLKSALEGHFESNTVVYNFRGDHKFYENESEVTENVTNVLPESVLNCLSSCIIHLASWQVINVFKTCIFHLKSALESLSTGTENEIYIEILSQLICCFLSSVRVAEHTVASNVIEKFIKGMGELKDILQELGTSLLNREHNHVLMRAYLSICYSWGELYIILASYRQDCDIQLCRTLDEDNAACNITYLHNYLTKKQWCTISQRITNFGEKPCKMYMQMLCIQKIYSIMLFEKTCESDSMDAVVREASQRINECWELFISEPFTLNTIVIKMDNRSLINLAEYFLKDFLNKPTRDWNTIKNSFLLDCQRFVLALVHVTLEKIKKSFRVTKVSGIKKKSCIARLFKHSSEDTFFGSSEDVKNLKKELMQIIDSREKLDNCELDGIPVNAEKLQNFLEVLQNLPVIYCAREVQVAVLIFLIALHFDIICYQIEPCIQHRCEALILGIIQNDYDILLDNVSSEVFVTSIFPAFKEYEQLFSYVVEGAFKAESLTHNFEVAMESIIKQLLKDSHGCQPLRCAVIFLNIFNKFKKYKLQAEVKDKMLLYKNDICISVLHRLTHNDEIHPEAFALILKNIFSQQEYQISEVTPLLEKYVQNLVGSQNMPEDIKGTISFFTTILHHKTQIKQDSCLLVMQIWNLVKHINTTENMADEFSQLVVIITEHVTNEEFVTVINELTDSMKAAVKTKHKELYCKNLKPWNSILLAHFNPVKMEVWQKALETVLKESFIHIADLNAAEEFITFTTNIIRCLHVPLTPTLTDVLLMTPYLLNNMETNNFAVFFPLVLTVLETLLKYRHALVMDRLPSFFQQYRSLLRLLCKTTSVYVDTETNEVRVMSDCAFQLEKLTKNLVTNTRDMKRISLYLIPDILQQYELFTLNPTVKLHLNNCLYSWISLCDQHAVSYLLRVLSPASTEIFKMSYENYKKYYRFTGKV